MFNAFALTGEAKYKNWVVEYVDAWKQRTEECGGNIPSNVGLDGKPGGEYNGQWWKGTYGWNFTIFDGELEKIAHRNYFTAASWPGFGNALLLTGDQILRRRAAAADGQHLRAEESGERQDAAADRCTAIRSGYKYDGRAELVSIRPAICFTDRLTEIYLWSMDRKDLERVPAKQGWIGFLEGNDPEYPVKALQADLGRVRRKMQQIRNDPTTPDTRLADYLLDMNPAATDALTNLTMGGYFANGRIWSLHSRFRYFDPTDKTRRAAGRCRRRWWRSSERIPRP